ncbi:hypothetical protein EE612_057067, partial [Oryza sativa]
MSSQRVALNDAAVPMTCGNAVAPGNAPPNLTPGPVSDTPWSASDHHSYPATPSRGTPAALFTSSRTFSARVSRATRSRARAAPAATACRTAASPPARPRRTRTPTAPRRGRRPRRPPPRRAPGAGGAGGAALSATARCLWKWRWRRQRAYIN